MCLPLYLYDHGGISISTGGFSCSWDSGLVGIIFITRKQLEKEKLAHLSDEKIEKYLTNEVKTYNSYLTGQVYGYTLEHAEIDSISDSCWGYFDMDSCIQDAKNMAEYFNKELETAHIGAGI